MWIVLEGERAIEEDMKFYQSIEVECIFTADNLDIPPWIAFFYTIGKHTAYTHFGMYPVVDGRMIKYPTIWEIGDMDEYCRAPEPSEAGV
jgi:hypothetical protein